MFATSFSIFENSQRYKSILVDLLALLFLILTTVFAFYPALDNSFVTWDDQYYVTENPLITNPSWKNLKALLTSIISLNYHPLTMMSLWINAYVSGVENAYPFIVTNITIHCFNVMLVFFLIKKMNVSIWISFITALIFAIHPMHVESVVWVSERKDVLYAFFFLLASIYYFTYSKKNRLSYYGFSFLFFTLACLSKAMAVSLVPVLYLYDMYNGKSILNIKNLLLKLPFILVALVIGCIAINVQAGGDFYGLLTPTLHAVALQDPSVSGFLYKLQVASYGLYFYIVQFFIPVKLSTFHPFSYLNEINSLFLYTIVPLSILGMLLIFRKSKKWVFGLGFFILTIFLVLQFVQVGSAFAAERYSYLPYIGLAYLLANAIYYFKKKIHVLPAICLVAIIGIYLKITTREQVNVWQDQVSLFSNVVDHYPNDGDAREYLAAGLWLEAKTQEAQWELEFAIDSLGHNRSSAYDLLANCYSEHGEIEKALVYYDKAIMIDSTNYNARYHRGLLMLDINPELALEDFTACAQSEDIYVRELLYEPRAFCHVVTGDYLSAIEDYSKAIELGKNLSLNYYDRGLSYENVGDTNSAISDYKKAYEVDTTYDKALNRWKYLENKTIN